MTDQSELSDSQTDRNLPLERSAGRLLAIAPPQTSKILAFYQNHIRHGPFMVTDVFDGICKHRVTVLVE